MAVSSSEFGFAGFQAAISRQIGILDGALLSTELSRIQPPPYELTFQSAGPSFRNP